MGMALLLRRRLERNRILRTNNEVCLGCFEKKELVKVFDFGGCSGSWRQAGNDGPLEWGL